MFAVWYDVVHQMYNVQYNIQHNAVYNVWQLQTFPIKVFFLKISHHVHQHKQQDKSGNDDDDDKWLWKWATKWNMKTYYFIW